MQKAIRDLSSIVQELGILIWVTNMQYIYVYMYINLVIH